MKFWENFYAILGKKRRFGDPNRGFLTTKGEKLPKISLLWRW
jgi:hypothetical protein